MDTPHRSPLPIVAAVVALLACYAGTCFHAYRLDRMIRPAFWEE